MEEIQQTQRPKRLTRMSAKRKAALENKENESKRRRTFNDFFTFCSFVLEYEEQLALSQHHTPHVSGSNVTSNSAGESSTSTTPTSSGSSAGGSDIGREDTPTSSDSSSDGDTSNEKLEYTSDDESWNLVTCFCRRPFAGRPMIECSLCKTWVHLFCAKIRKGRVPEVYTCPRCQVSSDSHTSPISTGQS